MANQSENKTIWTVALVAGCAILFWKVVLPKLKGGGGSGSGAAGSPTDPNYYQPWQQPDDSGNQNPLSAIGNFGGSGNPGKATPSQSGLDYPGANNTDFLNSLKEGLYTDADGNQGVMGAESNPDFGGDNLFTTLATNDQADLNLLNGSDGQIPSQDLSGTDSFLQSFSQFFQDLTGSSSDSGLGGSIVNPAQVADLSQDQDYSPYFANVTGSDYGSDAASDGNVSGDDGYTTADNGSTDYGDSDYGGMDDPNGDNNYIVVSSDGTEDNFVPNDDV